MADCRLLDCVRSRASFLTACMHIKATSSLRSSVRTKVIWVTPQYASSYVTSDYIVSGQVTLYQVLRYAMPRHTMLHYATLHHAMLSCTHMVCFSRPDCWTAGLLDCWTAGLLDCWTAGLLDCWTAGLLDCWTPVAGGGRRAARTPAAPSRTSTCRGSRSP